MNRHFRLYARPSFWEGMARIVDFGGVLNEYNYSDDPKEADFRAMQSDWEEIGTDFMAAIERLRRELEEQACGEKRFKE
jgi:hypothetical protein